MRKNITALLVIAAILVTANFQVGMSRNQQQHTSTVTDSASRPVLAEDTPVRLRLAQTISSGTSKVNDKVDFEVVEDVKVGDLVVIPQGGTAIATVTEAKPKKSFGRSGKLNVNIDYVRLTNGDKAPLRAVKGGSGGSRTGVMTGAVVATAIVFFPAAPLFFFIKGKNIVIPKGTEITGYIAADTPINSAPSNVQMATSTNSTPQPDSLNTDLSAVALKSSPDGAEITVDGKFMGTTPSTLNLPAGEHTVKIEKSGHKEWARTVTLSAGGNITVDATLEKK
ncbi:MAG TPA: PEGA domain-containing protein [Pyrinomonadaceae bacterium]|nr:PEGA domain-containing protein [Pyrinomonadaceae bacterium]